MSIYNLTKMCAIKGINQNFKIQLKAHNPKVFLKLTQKYQNKAKGSCHLQVK